LSVQVNMIAEHEMMTHEPVDLAIDLAACCADDADTKFVIGVDAKQCIEDITIP